MSIISKISVAFALMMISCNTRNIVLINKCIDSSITYQKVDTNDLLANPISFDNKYVDLEGIYYLGFEESSLVGRRGESAECIYVMIRNNKVLAEKMEDMDMKYVSRIRIKGEIDISEKGHLESCKAGIKNICYFEIIN